MPATLPVTCARCGASTATVGRFCPRCGAANTVEVVLRRLHAAKEAPRFAPFLPTISGATELVLHPGLNSIDELYTLAEVRRAYPVGVDERDMAWIWRRLLSVLAFLHGEDVVHAALFPESVYIEPVGHKLVLGGWWAPVGEASQNRLAVENIPQAYRPWFRSEAATRLPPTPALDVALAARTMIDLMGGDAVKGELPPTVDPALRRYFARCLHSTQSHARPGAAQLLHDFDRLIETLWGPRRYRPLALPPKRPSALPSS